MLKKTLLNIKMINKSEKGVSLLEAIISTAIIGIGFVAIFQMVQYSIRSIDVSGERTKATYLSSMIAEDLYSDKNQEKDKDTHKGFENIINILKKIIKG